MPGFNGTGPMGMGPRTGGGRGLCPPGSGASYGYGAGFARGAGRGGIPRGGGRGRAWGGGRGWQGAYAAGPEGAFNFTPQAPATEIEMLRSRSVAMEQELRQMRARIEELERGNERA